MQKNQILKEERRKTVAELLELLLVVQRMGHRLADETHGESYDLVRDLNDLLHQTRVKIEQIQETSKKIS